MTPSSAPLLATLDLRAAAARDWDVAIVGAGPAGALAARQAALAGAAVLLIDKATFPRGKVCGCCLNGAALSVLDSVGLSALPRRLGGRPLNKIRFAAGGRFAECELPGGVALSREALDRALVEAAIAAGAHFLSPADAARSAAEDLADPSPFRTLDLRQNSRNAAARAAVVLAADGLSGRLLHDEPGVQTRILDDSRLGAGTVLGVAPAFFEEGVIYMTSGRGGYVGLVRLEDDRLDVAAALDREAVRRHGGPGPLAATVVHDAGFPVPVGLEEAGWRGTPPLTRRPARPFAHRLLAVGDAAGYIEPFTGEGIAWALAGGAAVAPLAVAGAKDWSAEVGRTWERQHRQIVGRRQHACRWVSRLLRHRAWCAAAVMTLQWAPQLASPLVRSINQPFKAG